MAGAHAKLNKSATLGADKAATHLDALTRAYGRALRGAGRRAAARFRQTETLTAAVNPAPPDWTPPTADELIDQEELAADTERKTGKLHRLMLVSSAQTALEPFGIAFDVHAPTSQVVLDQFAQRIQATIASAINEQVTEAIQSGYAAGKSVAQVSSAIQQATDAISKPRADMLARSDLNGLANSGSLLAASMSGASSTKTWLATEDDRTRETHSDADGQTVAIDDTFDVGGEALQYPGDPAGSWEETANCRCVIVYGEPLTAAAGAVPTDFASWRDHAWEGDPVANRPVSAVTSGGTMSDLKQVILDIDAMSSTERAELRAHLDGPVDPAAERFAAVREHLAARNLDVLGDDELRAILLAIDLPPETTPAPGMPLLASAGLSTDEWALLAAAEGGTPWTATLCVADRPTVDSGIKRLLVKDGGSWLPLPLPLGLLDDTPHADLTTKSPVVGRIDQISWAGDVCQASGVFFDDSDDPSLQQQASKAAALVTEMRRMGVSVDLVDLDVEMMEWNGSSLRPLEPLDAVEDTTASEMDGPAQADVAESEEDADELELIYAFVRWVIGGATICPIQALTPATISIVAAGFSTPNHYRWFSLLDPIAQALTASAAGLAPLHPPADWFADPELEHPTALTVDEHGRVFGHMALWDSCHTGFAGQCIPPPRSPSNYEGFHLGAIKLDDGTRIPVGTLTMNTGHAGKRLSANAAVAHYDDTGTAAAFVRAGEDAHGIWVAGALSSRLSAEDAQTLMAAKPSGDWREVFRGRGRDMIGVLAVNVPGFPVPRSLTASGTPFGDLSVEFSTEMERDEFQRQLDVLSASADGIEGLAALAAA